MIVGSGCPVGPKGPKDAAHADDRQQNDAGEEDSFQTAYGTNGTPSPCVSSWYSCGT